MDQAGSGDEFLELGDKWYMGTCMQSKKKIYNGSPGYGTPPA